MAAYSAFSSPKYLSLRSYPSSLNIPSSVLTSVRQMAVFFSFLGWSQSPNRGSYYQEYFLRSMPWLCKKMRRPKVGKKKAVSCCKICACDAQGFKYRVRQHNVTYLQTRSLISGPLAETSLCPTILLVERFKLFSRPSSKDPELACPSIGR